MKKTIIIASIILFLILGIIVPKVFIKDFEDEFNDTTAEYACAKEQAEMMLNRLEKLITTKIAVTGRGFVTFLNVYTLFGIRYAEAEISCPDGGGQLERLWF